MGTQVAGYGSQVTVRGTWTVDNFAATTEQLEGDHWWDDGLVTGYGMAGLDRAGTPLMSTEKPAIEIVSGAGWLPIGPR
jgi:hypothetical protein